MKLNKATPFTRLGTAVYMNTAHLNPAEHAWEIMRLLCRQSRPAEGQTKEARQAQGAQTLLG